MLCYVYLTELFFLCLFICSHIVVILQYKASFACDRLGLCFHFGYIYACVAVFLCCYGFLVNKILDVDEILQHNIHWPHSERKNFKFLKI